MIFSENRCTPRIKYGPGPASSAGQAFSDHAPATSLSPASGADQLMIWGDTVHVPEVQTAIPEAGMAFDTDLAAAAAARKRMFDRVAADGVLIAGMHLHFPSFSRLKRRGDAYELIAEPWVHAFE